MPSYDTIVINSPFNAIKSFDENSFWCDYKTLKGDVHDMTYTLLPSIHIPGLENIRISSNNKDVILKANSALLGKKYHQRINKYTFPMLLENIKKTGIIEFDQHQLIEGSTVHKVDVTDDIKPSTSISNIITNSRIRSIKSNRQIQTFPHGLRISSISKWQKISTSLYDKEKQLNKETKTVKALTKIIDKSKFKGVLRIETNLKTFALMRKYLNLGKGEIWLKDVLHSKENVNYNIINELFTDETTEDITVNRILETATIDDAVKIAGRRAIIKLFNEDKRLINKFLRSKGTKESNPSEQIQFFKKELEDILKEDIVFNSYIKEIKHLLKNEK